MITQVCLFLAKLVPLFYFSHHFFLAISLAELSVVYFRNGLDNNGIAVRIPIAGNLLCLVKIKGEIDPGTDPSVLGRFEPTFLDKIRVLFFCAVIKNCSAGTISGTVVGVFFFTDSAVMPCMDLFAVFSLAHYFK